MKTKPINSIDFAQKMQRLTGEYTLNDMPRLQESLVEGGTEVIAYKLSGSVEHGGLPKLTLDINAKLPIACQRCFEAMPQTFNLSFDYLISKEEPEGIEELDDVDWLEPEEDMDLLALIEDELLLAMPFAPTHDTDCGAAQYESGERVNPFAVLKGKFK